MSDELAGRVALVTGSTRRIGRAIAEALAARGAALMIHGRSAEAEGSAVVEGITARGGRAALCLADIGDPDDAERLVKATVAAFGGIDILVNNAAVRQRIPLDQLTYADWRRTQATILDGAFLCAKAAAPYLKRCGHGRIINIGGASSFTGARDHVHVIAAKAGLVGLTRALAFDLGDGGVTVNLVSPGLVETPDDDPKRAAERRARFSPETMPAGRTGTPPDIASAIVALAGDAFVYMTGQTVHVNGGLVMG